ncbi:MAG: tRNA (adenine-N1)-methyltransferase [Thermoprotei archaeon]|nr:tRNA (adenine-N1)-methyltransferase [Thermoprotei archaeon]
MSLKDVIDKGDKVLLYCNGKKFLVSVEPGRVLHTHIGMINLDEIIGKRYGDLITTHIGERVYLLRPNLADYVLNVKRRTQIVYPKDIGIILLLGRVGPGSIVVEGGSGSGALTGVLAYMVRPNGKVFSYEVREEFLKLAKRNVEKLGVSDYVIFKHKDITKGIDERNIDTIILDIAAPWLVVEHAAKALKGGGYFISLSPTVDQVEKTVGELRKYNFIDISVLETFVRYWKIKEGESRPLTFMVGHTEFIVFARKVFEIEG